MSDVYFPYTKQKARKSYNCDACFFLCESWSEVADELLSPEQKEAFNKAKRNKFRIQKGEEYVKQNQINDGKFNTFKAIPAIDDICHKYGLYPEN